MKRVIVCEDEESIRSFVVISLKYNGYEVVEAPTGEDAIHAYEELTNSGKDVDIMLLDVMLPGINGFEVCKQIREMDKEVGIIMLTARSQDSEKVEGLKDGADDYITKPFQLDVFLARVESVYRRVSMIRSRHNGDLSSGTFVLDSHAIKLRNNDKVYDLTQLEFLILQTFFENPDKVFSRTELLNKVWGPNYEDTDGGKKLVDVALRRLRVKIEEDPSQPMHICNKRGEGFYWVP